ncbi:Protein DlpA [Phytophthora citrophthora]|uniref:Protein DlpA n=1 Tax=Phytophthora citrophthora TaxID=4793 RepID=A0AAD9LS32_9STRA|nr:Protein DlpA [Phytophthora citrophthora]
MESGNVYDYYIKLRHEHLRHKYVCYQCKKCDKKFTIKDLREFRLRRLVLHLQQSCAPNFVPNQVPRPPPSGRRSIPPIPVKGEVGDRLLQERLKNENPLDTDELLFRLAKLSTCVISDAMAKMKIRGCLVNVGLVRGYKSPSAMNICGPALTVKMMPSTGVTPASHAASNYIETAKMGQVVVISAPQGITTAVFGGLLATASKVKDVAGVVTDGRVRDLQDLSTMNFPAFASGTSVHGMYGSTTVAEVNSTLVVAGCVVRPNDIIRGDLSGVVVIPPEYAQEIALRAEIIEDQDSQIVEAVDGGEPMYCAIRRVRC